MKLGLLLLLVASTAYAADFVESKTAPQQIKCTAKKDVISFEGVKTPYKLYEKNLENMAITECEKLSIQGLQFYTVKYGSIINTPSGKKKILVYEVSLEKAKSLKTVRSEVIDELDASGVVPDSEFSRSLESKWGQSQKDKSILLMITMNEKNEKPFTYLLKFNSKKAWFENMF